MSKRTPKNKPSPLAFHASSYPESILFIHPHWNTPTATFDALEALANRSYALVELLISYLHDREDNKRTEQKIDALNESTLVNYLWQISGNLEMSQRLCGIAKERDRQLRTSG